MPLVGNSVIGNFALQFTAVKIGTVFVVGKFTYFLPICNNFIMYNPVIFNI